MYKVMCVCMICACVYMQRPVKTESLPELRAHNFCSSQQLANPSNPPVSIPISVEVKGMLGTRLATWMLGSEFQSSHSHACMRTKHL